MSTKFKFQVLDYSLEKSRFAVTVGDAVSNGDLSDLYDALALIGVGTQGTAVKSVETTIEAGSETPPVSTAAQRELKWLIRYQDDTTGKIFRAEYPCPNTAKLATNSDLADLTDSDVAAAVTEFESSVVAPDTGNAVSVISIQLVGRTGR